MLLYNRPVSDNNFRPEACLGVDDDMIPQDNTGADNGIILDAAPLAYVRVIVHDASRDRAVQSDNDPVVN